MGANIILDKWVSFKSTPLANVGLIPWQNHVGTTLVIVQAIDGSVEVCGFESSPFWILKCDTRTINIWTPI
jgi:hypothetical protein